MIEFIHPEPHHVPELGRICFEAFKGISEEHGFPLDLTTVEIAEHVIGLMAGNPCVHGVAAVENGKLLGSNFVSIYDDVAGVGPITIDPSTQGRGLGRSLMQWVAGEARANGKERIRLVQDSFNLASLSLYSSIGFDVKETVALMTIADAAAEASDPGIRGIVESDLDAVERLCRDCYGVSRRNEVAANVAAGACGLIRERGDRPAGFYLPGMMGFGAAESNADALALIREGARVAPAHDLLVFCPLRNTDLYRQLLKSGARAIKVETLMAMGPYEEPSGTWMPSILF